MKEKRSEEKQKRVDIDAEEAVITEKIKKTKKAKKAPKEKKPTDKLADKSGTTKFLQHIFGDAQKRTLRRLGRRVEEINKLGAKYSEMSDDELKEQTEKLKKRLAKLTKQEQAKLALEKLKAEKGKKGSKKSAKKTKAKPVQDDAKALDAILPNAFALVREASDRVLKLRPFDVQLIGGIVLHEGNVAEMKTGEGKTLVATLPAYLNALTGRGVHVVTVNDYLAQRDAGWMGELYNWLGLSVGVIINEASFCYDPDYSNEEHDDERMRHLKPCTRKEAYNCDITYGTNNEFGFDYLRDNMVKDANYLRQRELNFAIVDEVDSILIDEARTPLIISAPAADNPESYYQFAKVCAQLASEDYVVDEKRRTVALTDEGVEKVQKILGIDTLYSTDNTRIVYHLEQALRAETLFHRDKDYVVTNSGEVIIVDEHTGRLMQGRRYNEGLHQAIEAKEGVLVRQESTTLATISFQNFFRLYRKLSGMTGTAFTEAEEFQQIYALDVIQIPPNKPIIRVDKDDLIYRTTAAKLKAIANEVKEYHEKGQPVLIGSDSIENNEMIASYLEQQGIPFEILNAKNNEREAAIIAKAGEKGAVTLATNMAGRGTDIKLSDEVKAAGGLAIIGTERHESRRVDRQLRGRAGRQGDPGSSVFYVSLEDKLMRLFASERIASVMDRLGFAEGERIESPMISKSIERAQKKVEENHFGIRKRLLEYDDVMNKQRTVIYEKRRHALMGERIGMDIANILWDRTCNIVENNDFEGCKEAFIKIFAMECPFSNEQFINTPKAQLEEITFDKVMETFNRKTERIRNVANPVIAQVYENQGAMYERIMVPITDGKRMFNIGCNLKEAYESESKTVVKEFEKAIMLHIIDDCWKENLRALDDLKHSVQNASYEQKDPLVIFKLESAKLFDDMVDEMNNHIVSILMRGQIPEIQQEEVREAAPEQHSQRYQETKENADQPVQEQLVDENQKAAAHHDTRAQAAEVNRTPIRKDKLPGPNDPCPCGSGKKFKKCHGRGLI